ncbi:arginase family protein [Microbacterium ulmi]|uniref:Arginase family protein n=1 Tax=Microbacterium ulmi TaxID=179095 RepID=A0A7Y2LYS0_9MICO|nr:arginase family protein [Microbacterium ulmi]NII68430.1 formiminoglutamase/agmatinase [Microbacterium ulmi]NNH03047.1 arginase family protein [Microbacterium ulmi]
MTDPIRTFELVGAPFDGAATLGWPGSRHAPARIRESLAWMTMRSEGGQVFSLDTGGLLPAGPDLIRDAGDVAVVPHDVLATLDAAAQGVSDVVRRGSVPILLGGDDSLLLAGARGLHDAVEGTVAIVHFDAHLDLMDESVRQGRFSHSSGMRRALELDRVRVEHSIQLGPRHFNYPSSLRFIQESGLPQIPAVEVIEAGWRPAADRVLDRIRGADHVFFSFDIDTIDPAHAPGAGAHEPGGITSRDAIELVKVLAPHCDAFAVTEVNPMTDHNDLTSNLAAYLCYYFAVFGAVAA